ncbi:hypothetical protein [Gordonia neofelifaecis]|uniref:Uncharacterized protein n=1 Tax=Gordonia neofelifaecis NRRL B-59395 TaxID=644548 RepID=F1YHE9_9ACTN|nr:hypothetical protein [Gordonia neofelifaecis]EGD55787.1 hypothetical protein SCNU_06085 [Gordonia neofelifaecis NRRL B-59395]
MSGRHRGSEGASWSRRRTATAASIVFVIVVGVTAAGLMFGRGASAQSTDHEAHVPGPSLRASFEALDLPAPAGVALAPVGSTDPIVFGDTTPQDAWSVIKVPLALAAERRHGMTRTEAAAVIDSDNASARILTKSLGSPAEASEALAAVLDEGHDSVTSLPASTDGTHPHFGETRWALSDSAVWTASLPCMLGSGHVISLMTGVSETQRWGIERIAADVAVKGGWGAASDGGYVVRQIGVVTLPDGSQTAVSISTHTPQMTFERGVQVLDRVARWLDDHLDSLPGGHCRSAA